VIKLLSAVVPVLLIATAAFLVVRQRSRDPKPYFSLKSLDPSYLAVQQAMRGEYGSDPRAATHLLPPEGDGPYLAACCGTDVFALIAEHQVMTIRPERVTCGGEVSS